MKDNKFYKAVFMSIGLVALLAIMDILGKSSHLFDSSYNGTVNLAWWHLYQSYAYILLFTLPIFYYFLVKRDKAEAIALFLNSWILWNFGLEDLLFYNFLGIPLDKTLPWLDGMPAVHFVTSIFGEVTTTSSTLVASVIAGFVVIYLLDGFVETHKLLR